MQIFIFRHIGSISGIKVKRHFHLFIHLRRGLLRIRILFLLQFHQIGQMRTAMLVKGERILFGNFRIFRCKAALRIRHNLVQSRDQLRIWQNFTVPYILWKIAIKVSVQREIFLISFQSQCHFFRRHLSRCRGLHPLLHGERILTLPCNFLPVFLIGVPFKGYGNPGHINGQHERGRQKKARAPAS